MSDSPEYFEGIAPGDIQERHSLAMERIALIPEENTLKGDIADYFKRMAFFYLKPSYDMILPGKYEESYYDPAYAVRKLGEGRGQLLSFVSYESLNIIPFRAEKMLFDEVIMLELFLELYGLFLSADDSAEVPDESIRSAIKSFVYDYMDHSVRLRVRAQIDPSLDFALRIINESDLSDISYLDLFGEYVNDDVRKTAEFIASLPEEKIRAMADTFTGGFIKGFEVTGKDISKKKTVNIRYELGFERVVKAAAENFEKEGLKVTLMRRALYAANRNSNFRIGYEGACNRQMEFDHRDDRAVFVDKAFAERKLEIIRSAYEEFKEEAAVFAGPAIMETFGAEPFSPVNKKESLRMSGPQQRIMLGLSSEMGKIVNRYIPGEERSYTIISYPVPKIGPQFKEIFEETIKVNTLDYEKYRDIQQKLILALEKGRRVRVRGKNGNRTDITVSLHDLKDPAKETIFENCVADVNIPLGEVFTSPALKGTGGILHVTEVYLFGLRYENLEFRIKDGFIEDYNCTNFETGKENKDYIRENILHNHDSLPMGEFAIGTNTTAYRMAKKYDIFSRLEILIAEKTGPHFAFGDTCYSRAEDIPVYNPDGREIVSRDNEHTEKRKTDPSFRYYECHTDVTIPYDELLSIVSVDDEGNEYPLIEDGLFAVPGTEELNVPLSF
ncbi:MAG: aminopeptidase [Lachnospiraceae bacterium]|nr:aminopeptidase [Lachnospiraceae bacterium]